MRKKVTVFTSIIFITVILLSGCGSGGESKSAGKTLGNASGEKVKLTAIMTKHPLTKPLAEMEWLQQVEDAAGVEIEWQEITADWGQKKGTMLASGDIPDLFIGPNVITDADFTQFQGLFQDLSGMLDQAPNVQNIVQREAGDEADCHAAGRQNLRPPKISAVLASLG